MIVSDIILNDKAKFLLKDKTRFILLAGPTGTGKTFIGGLKTYLRVVTAPKGRDTFAIVAESQVTAEKMFVDDPSSFANIFPNCKYFGGKKPHIRVETVTGFKRIYLGGYGTARDWKKILGLNLHGIHIEEGTIAHDDFVREAFVRVSRLVTKPFLHVTTNGGVPEQILYTEFFNKSYYDVEFNKNIPFEERNALKQSDRNFKYYYWGFEDSVTMEADQIKDLYNLFPVGSFFYNSKILGIRGYSTGMCYASILTDLVLSKDNQKATWVNFEDLKLTNFIELGVGIDTGNSAKTVFCLTGWTKQYQRAIVVSVYEVEMTEEKDYTHIIEEFNKWIIKWYSIFYTSITQIRVDKSNPLFIKQLRNNMTLKNIPVTSSISGKIVERVAAKQQFIKQMRLMFVKNKEGETMVNMLKAVKDDGKGGHIDNNTPEIDYSDALDYSMEHNYNKMGLYKFRG